MTIVTIIFTVNLCLLNFIKVSQSNHFDDECTQQIYRQCNHRTTFTAKEIITAQLYLERRFNVTNPLKPSCEINPFKPPCIRKDIKCLTRTERTTLTNAWVQLYRNGVIAKFTKIHNDHWGAEHKFIQGPRWHFWFILQLEKELQKIDPSICMPYWNYPQDFAHPEKSIVWDIFGRAGNPSNDYCVPDGPFANIQCTFPSTHCLKRQWRVNPLIDAWKGPEYNTMYGQLLYNDYIINASSELQSAQTTPEMEATIGNALKYIDIVTNTSLTPYPQRVLFAAIEAHFDTHLAIGGWNGDISVMIAPNDPIFFVFHIYAELMELLWQLSDSDDFYLVPKSWNGDLKYDNITATYRYSDIDSDTFSYYTDILAAESFQFGYGEMCHLYDVIIEPINELVNQNLLFETLHPFSSSQYNCVPDLPTIPFFPLIATLPNKIRSPCNAGPLPIAAQRLKDCLSASSFQLYFPKFASNKWTFFDHVFPDISEKCNPVSNRCRKMPFAVPMTTTPEGQRQYQAFNKTIANFDMTGFYDIGEVFYQKFMNELNACYCSPYV